MEQDTILEQASNLMSNGNLEEASLLLSKGLETFPNNENIYFLYAALLAQKSEYEAAIEYYTKALELNPKLHIGRFQMGLLLATLGQDNSCITVLTPLQNQPATYLGMFSIAIIATLQNDLTTAQEAIANGIEINKENPNLNHDMRDMLSRIEKSLAEQATSTNHSDSTKDEKTVDEADGDMSHLLDIYQTKH